MSVMAGDGNFESNEAGLEILMNEKSILQTTSLISACGEL